MKLELEEVNSVSTRIIPFPYIQYTVHVTCRPTDFIHSSTTANIMSVISRIKGSCHCIFCVTSFIDWPDNCNDHQGSWKNPVKFKLKIATSVLDLDLYIPDVLYLRPDGSNVKCWFRG